MLNGNDIQLFYKLLDSLSNSLRELAVKYELLVATSTRQAGDRERTDAAVMDMARGITVSFSSMARDFELLKELASDGRDNDVKLSSAVQAMSKTMDSIESKLASVVNGSESVLSVANEGKSITLHVDSHMDAFGGQLASIQAASADVAKMMQAVEEMKKQFEPFKKLAVIFTKPVALIMAIYIIITTIMAAVEGCDQFDKFRGKTPSSVTHSVTNTTVQHPSR